MTTFDGTSQTSTGHGCSTVTDVKPSRKTHISAHQSSFRQSQNNLTRKTAKLERTTQNVEWLMKELESCPGYDDFCSTLNHIRDNPGAVRSWTFAVDFMEAHNKTCLIVSAISLYQLCYLIWSGLQNGVLRKVPKVDIMKALSIGQSWFFDASKAVGIMRKYGEGGTHRSQQVIDNIASTAEAPEGSTKLLQWLKTWEKEHPIWNSCLKSMCYIWSGFLSVYYVRVWVKLANTGVTASVSSSRVRSVTLSKVRGQ